MHIRVWKGLGEFFTKKNKTKIQIEIKVIVFLFVFFCFGLDIGWHPELNYSFALFLSFLLLLFCAQSVGGIWKFTRGISKKKPKRDRTLEKEPKTLIVFFRLSPFKETRWVWWSAILTFSCCLSPGRGDKSMRLVHTFSRANHWHFDI